MGGDALSATLTLRRRRHPAEIHSASPSTASPSSSIDSVCVMGVGDSVFVLQTQSLSFQHTHTHTTLQHYLPRGPAGGKLSSADKLMECALQTKHAALVQLVVRMWTNFPRWSEGSGSTCSFISVRHRLRTSPQNHLSEFLLASFFRAGCLKLRLPLRTCSGISHSSY